MFTVLSVVDPAYDWRSHPSGTGQGKGVRGAVTDGAAHSGGRVSGRPPHRARDREALKITLAAVTRLVFSVEFLFARYLKVEPYSADIRGGLADGVDARTLQEIMIGDGCCILY